MEWIKSTDQLPKAKQTNDVWEKGKSHQCLVYMNGLITTGYYWSTTNRWIIPGFHGEWKPSHWMPCPNPPKT